MGFVDRKMDRMCRLLPILTVCFVLICVPAAWSAGGPAHEDSIAPVLLALILILATAKAGSELFERLGMPAVLGELVVGIVIGNLVLINPAWNFFEPLRVSPIDAHWALIIDGLARLGVIILLFEVGLESTVQGMLKVGVSSFIVAVIGVIVPALLGFGVSFVFIKEIPAQLSGVVPAGFSLFNIHLFIGCVLCATSVGITARVFQDLQRLYTREAQIVLGAAVIDDVLGLIVLAVVSSIVSAAELGRSIQAASLLKPVAIAVLFLGGALIIGTLLIPRIMGQLAKLRTAGIMLISSLLLAFTLSYLAGKAGLAAIVGAFAAGLLLEKVHFKGFRENADISHLVRPVASFLVPIFFMLMGIQVRLESFANLSILGIAAGLTVAAIIGKQICALGAIEKGLDRCSIGIGMIPRGEVGLIFANIGRDLNVVDSATFSAAVIMVMVTTLVTPPLLKVSIAHWDKKHPRSGTA